MLVYSVMVDQGLGEFELAAIANLGLDSAEEVRDLVPSVFAGVPFPPPPSFTPLAHPYPHQPHTCLLCVPLKLAKLITRHDRINQLLDEPHLR